MSDNKYGVFTDEGCGALYPHNPHSWREGFLWHRKLTCKGHTEESITKRDELILRLMNPAIGIRVTPEIFEHKHFYFLKWSDEKTLMFECEQCQHQLRMDRIHFYFQMTDTHLKHVRELYKWQ